MKLDPFPKSIQTFFSDYLEAKESAHEIAKEYRKLHSWEKEKEKTFVWILSKSKLPWLQLAIRAPYKQMLLEAKRIRHLFADHRSDPNQKGYVSKGWKALCLHGLGPHKTLSPGAYGYKKETDAPYRWTKIADLCPVTTAFFKRVYPCSEYYRVRYSLLEPGGYILPHIDRGSSALWEVNLALNHPKGCLFKMKNKGYVPQAPRSAFVLDVSSTHAVINASNEDRYHIIVHGNPIHNIKYRTMIERSYAKFLTSKT